MAAVLVVVVAHSSSACSRLTLMKGLVIKCSTESAWRTLRITESHSSCVLEGLGDIHPFNPPPLVASEHVEFVNCNKNFVFYWLPRKLVFPNMKTLVLASHPCEPVIVRWLFRQKHMNIQVSSFYWNHMERWERVVGVPIPGHITKV